MKIGKKGFAGSSLKRREMLSEHMMLKTFRQKGDIPYSNVRK